MPDFSDKLPNFSQLGQRPTASYSSGSSLYDWAGSFVKSAIESVPELVGITPSPETLEWRQDSPVAGFASSMLGTAVPYVGWFKATRALTKVDDAIQAIGNLEKAPFLTGAAREVARFAPFEAGRVAVSQVVGDEPFGSMLGEATLNLAVGAGLGGLLTGIGSAGARTASRRSLIPGVDIGAPVPLQIRQISEMLARPDNPPELVPRLGFELNRLRTEARIETAPQGRYLGDLEGDANGVARKGLNRLFQVETGQGAVNRGRVMLRRRFAQSGADFPADPIWRGAAESAGLPENFQDLGQYFRHISFTGEAKQATNMAKAVERTVTRGMESVGDNWFLAREADDGLFVMAKRVPGGEADLLGHFPVSPADRWVIFKTDRPGAFITGPEKWATAVVERNRWVSTAEVAKDGGGVYNTLKGFIETHPLFNYRETSKPGVFARFIPERLKGPTGELTARIQEAAKEYLAPAIHQFKKSPRANYIWSSARAAYDAAETAAQKILYGEQLVDKGRNIYFQALRNNYDLTEGSIKQVLDELSDEEIAGLHYLWRNKVPSEQYEALVGQGVVPPKAAEAAWKLGMATAKVWDDLSKARIAIGDKPGEFLNGYFGLPRKWEGDTRIDLLDGDGNLQVVAAGLNKRTAQKEAEAILAENPTWQKGDEYSLSERGLARDPIRAEEGVGGFRWDRKPWTREELMQELEIQTKGRYKEQATISVDHLLSPQLDKLKSEDPVAYRMLVARLNDKEGKQGAFSQWQNRVTDKVLAPILGTDSASKIVSVTNSAMWHLQLGALKMAYPVANALTFVQTVIPEVAYIMTAAPEQLAGRYTYFAAAGTKGTMGGMGVLNPLRIMRDSFREMRTPGVGLRENIVRASNDRVIEPRFVEDYIGESAVKLRDLRTAVSSGKGFLGWLKALSEFVPSHSERLSRAHAFTTGHLVGRDHLGLTGDKLYYFARQFTENTMYLYSSSDRPRMFTTPAGSTLGLFKNWMFNYMATMMEYTGEGIARNNWAPLMWQTAGTFALGGLAATPLYWVANAFAEGFTDKSLIQLAYNDYLDGDALMFGLPASLTGVSLFSQVNSPVSNPIRDATTLFDLVILDRINAFAGGAGAVFDHWQATGEHPGRNPRALDFLVRSFAPTTLYRGLAVANNEGTIRSLSSGYPSVGGMGLAEKMLYTLGFNPTALDREMIVADQLFEQQASRRAAVERLGQAWANAQAGRDGQQMNLILRQATVLGVDASSVIRSGLARLSKAETPLLERSFRPQDVREFRNVLER